jgi:diacylglycerol kinase (ATP)
VIQIVVTPGSGNGRAGETAEYIRRELERSGRPARVARFHDLRRLTRWSSTCPPAFSHLICVGGDATMSAAAPAAIRHRVPLLPVPCGFGNLFARTFGHTDEVERLLQALDESAVVWVDAGSRHGAVFLCHESFGPLDDIQNEVEHGRGQPRTRLLRWLAYYRMGVRFLGRALPSSLRVEVDGAVVVRRAVLVTVANVRAYGEFLPLTPDASPTDGLLDVFVIPRTSRLGFWTRLIKLLLHIPPRGEEVIVRRGRRVSVGRSRRRMEEMRILPAVLPVLVAPGWRDSAALEGAAARERDAAAQPDGVADRQCAAAPLRDEATAAPDRHAAGRNRAPDQDVALRR